MTKKKYYWGAAKLACVLIAFVFLTGKTAPNGCAGEEVIYVVASADNTLFDTSDGSKSNGAGSHLFAGIINQPLENPFITRRALLWFDIASVLPANAIIKSVTLQMNTTLQIYGEDSPMTVHTVLSPWGEGTSNSDGDDGGGKGAASTTDDATWLHTFFNTQTWTAPGGDFDPVAISETMVGLGPVEWPCTDDFIAVVQDWVNTPANNLGLLVAGDENFRGTARRFDSREAFVLSVPPNNSNLPTLEIVYSTP